MLSSLNSTSGEFLYRTHFFNTDSSDVESSLPSLPAPLHTLLQKESSTMNLQLSMLRRARKANGKRTRRRMRILQCGVDAASAVAKSKLLEVLQKEEGRMARMDNLIKVSKAKLIFKAVARNSMSVKLSQALGADRALLVRCVLLRGYKFSRLRTPKRRRFCSPG